MKYRCICGRFMKRLEEGVGMPLTTGFLPNNTATTVPHALFVCWNPCHWIGEIKTVRAEYKIVFIPDD